MEDSPVFPFYSKLFWSILLILLFHLYLKYVTFDFWMKQNIPHENPLIPLGNIYKCIIGKVSIGELLQQSYEKFKMHPFHGFYIFHKPILIVNDPDLIGLVMIKDFQYFQDRVSDDHIAFEPLMANLFFERGRKWKNNRMKISPGFTSGKIKEMFHLIDNIGENLKQYCELPAINREMIDLKDLAARYTTDVIGSIAYGCKCNSIKNPQEKFHMYAKKIFDVSPMKFLLIFFAPIILRIFRLRTIQPIVTKYFIKIFKEVVSYRRENKVPAKDFIALIIQLMEHGYIEEKDANKKSHLQEKNPQEKGICNMDIVCAAAQSFVFFAAGFETTSATITYCLYEMALNPEIQEKLRLEIKKVISRFGALTYDSISEMSYLQKVLYEALRMYPPGPILYRVCLKDYKIPNTNFVIPEGMKITIPVMGIHNDRDIYPDPQKFDPERFDVENIAQRHSMSYLAFGEGPRMCIGKRFGLILTKVILIKLLSQYKFSTCEKTEIPIKHNVRTFTLTPDKSVYLKIETV